MDIKATSLPVTPVTARAFQIADFAQTVNRALGDKTPDDGVSRDSTLLKVRAAETLIKYVPHADEQQIACALVFLTPFFGRGGQPASALDRALMPEVYAMAREWKDVQRGILPLSQASEKLRQVVTAADVAVKEALLSAKSSPDVDIMILHHAHEKARWSAALGEIGAPALQKHAEEVADKILLAGAKIAQEKPKLMMRRPRFGR